MKVSVVRRALCEEYETGTTLMELGEKYHLSHERIRQILMDEGCVRRSPGVQRDTTANAPAERRRHERLVRDMLILLMYSAGCKYNVIMSHAEVRCGWVAYLVRRYLQPNRRPR